ncbi:Plasmodium exported protein, unknown function [Plasmodium gonderi]|uniref:Variable surface protein n=1 Tax=Plasmodium gonderi TaxID=77519 RepID=A0A1Y1JT72_PLAGO|nr:Plasmodium exported protein, unknown function [Plasmodium gonderi]GAW84655.1 Plasmodium exported protein, unknown function [Plasmodium gonderi]
MAKKQPQARIHLNLLLLHFSENDLNSVKFYSMMNNNSLELRNPRLTYCRNFSYNFDNLDKIKELCLKYLNYLIYLNIKRSNYNYNKIICNLLSFWLYEKLSETLKDENMRIIAFGDIQRMWSYVYNIRSKSSNFKCVPYDSIVRYYHYRENAKKLYDYYFDFNYLYHISRKCDASCTELCMYLNKIKEAYDYFNVPCNNGKKTYCPVFVKKNEDYDPKKLLQRASCMGYTNEHHDESDTTKEKRLMDQEEEPLAHNELMTEDSSDLSDLISVEPNPIITFRNSLLGLVLLSMLFGLLYKVYENYINLYKFYKLLSKLFLHLYYIIKELIVYIIYYS